MDMTKIVAVMDEIEATLQATISPHSKYVMHSNVEDAFKDTQFTQLGSGNFSRVFACDATPDVVYKIIVRTDESYLKYVKACTEVNFKYSWMPVVYGHRTVGFGSCYVNLIALERLRSVDPDQDEQDATECEYFEDGDQLSTYLRMGIPTFFTLGDDISPEGKKKQWRKLWARHRRMVNDPNMWLYMHRGIYRTHCHPEIKKIAKQARRFFFYNVLGDSRHWGVSSDIGPTNVMLRKDGSIVLSDPLC